MLVAVSFSDLSICVKCPLSTQQNKWPAGKCLMDEYTNTVAVSVKRVLSGSVETRSDRSAEQNISSSPMISFSCIIIKTIAAATKQTN